MTSPGQLFPLKLSTALIPMFFSSNYFYAYQAAINTAKFDGPTRALNATLEGAGAIVGALMIGYFVLDGTRFGRRTRGFMGLGVVTVLTVIIWSCGLAWQLSFTRESLAGEKAAGENVLINYHDENYKGKGALYFFCKHTRNTVSSAETDLNSKTTLVTLVTKRWRIGS